MIEQQKEIIQESNKILTLGDPINIRDLPGVIIRMFIGLDQYPEFIPEIEYGGWQPGHPAILEVLQELSKCAGPKNRVAMYNYANKLGFNWPVDNSGIPAYLRKINLLYSTKEGTLFEYVWKDE